MALCLSLSEPTLEGCKESLKLLGSGTVEVRVDLISEEGKGQVDEDGLKEIFKTASAAQADTIITVRDLKEAGFTERRLELVKMGLENGANMVDIEIEAPEEYRKAIIDFVRKINRRIQVIVSYHNYDLTPDAADLKKLVNTCFEYEADIAKIATAVNNVQDSARLLSLYSDDRKIVALGMGKLGMITRLAAIKLGSPFTFVAESESKLTAPGQLTKTAMESILKILD
mmetsp:Transcript_16263/g.18386  ORF Transcript_16263/g.18386 Transcript_16263/m.18386 type:complete len:228 (-) Transcript_16263:345-1028(-)